MTPKKKRFYLLFSAFTFFCFVVGTILIVLQDNILFFYTPSEILQKNLECLEGFYVVTGVLCQ